jgi:hypothetical protein
MSARARQDQGKGSCTLPRSLAQGPDSSRTDCLAQIEKNIKERLMLHRCTESSYTVQIYIHERMAVRGSVSPAARCLRQRPPPSVVYRGPDVRRPWRRTSGNERGRRRRQRWSRAAQRARDGRRRQETHRRAGPAAVARTAARARSPAIPRAARRARRAGGDGRERRLQPERLQLRERRRRRDLQWRGGKHGHGRIGVLGRRGMSAF